MKKAERIKVLEDKVKELESKIQWLMLNHPVTTIPYTPIEPTRPMDIWYDRNTIQKPQVICSSTAHVYKNEIEYIESGHTDKM